MDLLDRKGISVGDWVVSSQMAGCWLVTDIRMSYFDRKENGYVLTVFNRLRPIPEINSSNFMQRSFGERVAMNSPIQGTAADIMKLAMVAVDRELEKRKLESRIVLQVHDELLVECPKEEVDEVRSILKEKMEDAAKLKVKLITDINVGETWYDCH